MEIEDMIILKKGDPIEIKIDYARLKGDRKYHNMTGQIVDTVEVGSSNGHTMRTGYVVYLHRKRELCAFSQSELKVNDKTILKERVEEVKKRLKKL